MNHHNILCVILNALILFFYSFGMETQREEVAKQLIAMHNIKEQEKKLLEEIIKAYPEWLKINPSSIKTMQETDFSIYTPDYFKNLLQVLEIFKRTGQASQHEETLKNQAILYITYVAINNIQWPTIDDKLIYMNNCFQQYALSYLQAAWERYKPTMAIILTPQAEKTEEEPLLGRVEELSSEEEEKSIAEEFPTSSSTQQKITQKSHRQFEKRLSSPKKPEPQPNIFTRTIHYIWSGMSSILKWFFSWFR
ncbi:MAG TPA: hypothetical protein VHX42_03470 [Candidatus Babeliales bacterium]|jgi:hypothetical protein|nr:hypothetical protein [Candidatus Babeliales bacterium]